MDEEGKYWKAKWREAMKGIEALKSLNKQLSLYNKEMRLNSVSKMKMKKANRFSSTGKSFGIHRE